MWTFTNVALVRFLTQLIANPPPALPEGPLAGVWLGLYVPPTTPITPQSNMGNIVEAGYSGYSRQQVVWFPAWLSQAGPAQIAAQDLWFSPTDALIGNNIQGVFLADAFYGGVLLAGAPLAAPGRVLASPADALKVQPVVQLPSQQIYGSPNFVS